MKNPPYKLVYIEWDDAHSNSGWKSKEDMFKWGKQTDMRICQVGWLVDENKRYIQLSSQYGPPSANDADYELWGHHQKIPTTWIRKRKVIKL